MSGAPYSLRAGNRKPEEHYERISTFALPQKTKE
jgi:hypothetical protein